MAKRPDIQLPASETGAALLWQCGALRVDERSLQLWIHARPVEIEPRPLALLILLLRRAGEVLTRQDIIDALWAGRPVSEEVISKCVARLRASLGAEHRQLIRTVHGFGYRLEAEAQVLAPDGPPGAPSLELLAGQNPPHRPHWRLLKSLSPPATVWLAEHEKTGERRVFKFAADEGSLVALQREVMIQRLLRKSLAEPDAYLYCLDWNHAEPPFFNEYPWVEDGSLQEFLAQPGAMERSTLAQRLEWVAQIADALAAAHGIGVLHKDIKPANILITRTPQGEARCLLADFGAGDLLEPERLAALEITQALGAGAVDGTGSTLGTPLYLAPELLAGKVSTVRSDIYALGVLLYQLVSGSFSRPLSPGWERRIDDPVLRQDIAEACELSPRRRLGDAAELARRLRQLPERSRAQLATQQRLAEAERAREELLRMRIRRRWQAVSLVVLLLAALLTSVLYVDARRAAGAELAARQSAEAMNRFLNDELLGAADPFRPGGGRGVTVAEVLDRAAEALPRSGGLAAATRVDLAASLATAYGNLVLWQAGQRLLEREVAAAAAELGDGHPQLVRLRLKLAELAAENDDYAVAARQYAVLRAAPPRDPDLVWRARYGEGWLQYKRGEFVAAAAHYRQLLDELARDAAGHRQLMADSRWNLAEVHIELGDYAAADAELQQVEAHYAQSGLEVLGDWVQVTRANLLLSSGQLAAAETHLVPLLARTEERLGDHHNIHLFVMHFMGMLRLQQGRQEEAAQLFERSLERRQRVHERAHHFPYYATNRLGEARCAQGKYASALLLIREAQAAFVERLGDGHIHSLRAGQNLADCLQRAGQPEAAVAQLEQLLPLAGADAGIVPAYLHLALAQLAAQQQQPQRAAREREQARALYERAYGRLGQEHSVWHDRRLAELLRAELQYRAAGRSSVTEKVDQQLVAACGLGQWYPVPARQFLVAPAAGHQAL